MAVAAGRVSVDWEVCCIRRVVQDSLQNRRAPSRKGSWHRRNSECIRTRSSSGYRKLRSRPKRLIFQDCTSRSSGYVRFACDHGDVMRLVYGGLFPGVAEKYVADNPPTDSDDKTPKLLWRVSKSAWIPWPADRRRGRAAPARRPPAKAPCRISMPKWERLNYDSRPDTSGDDDLGSKGFTGPP